MKNALCRTRVKQDVCKQAMKLQICTAVLLPFVLILFGRMPYFGYVITACARPPCPARRAKLNIMSRTFSHGRLPTTSYSKVSRNAAPLGDLGHDSPTMTAETPLSMADLQQSASLRKALPDRVAVQLHAAAGAARGEGVWEARLRIEADRVILESVDPSAVQSPIEVAEEPSAPRIWRVVATSGGPILTDTLVSFYDCSPAIDVPESLRSVPDSSKYMTLLTSNLEPGPSTWESGGFGPAACPRAADGVNIIFVVWGCRDGSRRCSILEEGEDPRALVCEYPPVIQNGLKLMTPGETRRFWIPALLKDRRFGRPVPDRFLPPGDLVVDIHLRSVEKEAVFNHNHSPEALKLIEEREWSPRTLLIRGSMVCLQFAPWVYFYNQYHDPGAVATLSNDRVIEGLNGALL